MCARLFLYYELGKFIFISVYLMFKNKLYALHCTIGNVLIEHYLNESFFVDRYPIKYNNFYFVVSSMRFEVAFFILSERQQKQKKSFCSYVISPIIHYFTLRLYNTSIKCLTKQYTG